MAAPPSHPQSPPSARSLPVAGPTPPPFGLLRLHFATGLLCWCAGGLGLVLLSPTLAAGTFLAPAVLGLTHLFTLGWIGMAIVGTLYQLFPAFLGVSARSLPVAWLTYGTLIGGTLLLATGLYTGIPGVLLAGWTVLLVAVFAQAWNLLPARRRSARNRLSGWYFSLSHMGLGLALLLVLGRIGSDFGWWTAPRLGLLAGHVQLATLGFATLAVVGAGSRMIPMFLGAAPDHERPLEWLWRIALVGLLLFVGGSGFGVGLLTYSGMLGMALAVVIFLTQALGWFRRRAQPGLDPGTGHIASAFLWLTLALVTGLVLPAALSAAPALPLLYGLMVIPGWLSLVIAGVLYRILPALTWNRRHLRKAGQPGTPTPAELSRPGWGWASLILLNLGLGLMLIGVGLTLPALVRTGAVGYLAGVLTVLIHHFPLLRE